MPGESAEVHFWYTGVGDSNGENYQPTPDTVVLGSMMVRLTAFDPCPSPQPCAGADHLDPKDAEGRNIGQAVQQAKRAAPIWTGPLSETYDKGTNWKTALASSAAISNPFNVPVIIDVLCTMKRAGLWLSIMSRFWPTGLRRLSSPMRSGTGCSPEAATSSARSSSSSQPLNQWSNGHSASMQ